MLVEAAEDVRQPHPVVMVIPAREVLAAVVTLWMVLPLEMA
tara:strand:- start:174 stop:296 length:123 start_codon:yes stop_codon:yes gene_type:complete